MSAQCPIGLNVDQLRTEVQAIYGQVAEDPSGDFHFHRGPDYAARALDYDRAELAELPDGATASFAGVANPHKIAPLLPGETVLDIGSGSGMDLLLAARAVGPEGRAIGVDMTEAMRAKARAAAEALGLAQVEVRAGDALELPVEDASVDVVISNGVINLVPDKNRAFSEIARVLRPGGRLQLGDIVVGAPLSEGIRSDIDLWTS
ncbi:MAG: methyltransferase domain-containing protein [Myxococcota bacterium]